jgi:phage terminase large subunit-like protein
LIYTLDEGDDYRDESVWEKANPNLGITVAKRYLRDRITQAQSIPSMEIDVKTKNFNMYVQSAETWITDAVVMKSFEKIELDKLKGELAFGAIDLASVSDMTAVSLMFPPNPDREYYPDKYIFYSRAYLPEDALVNSPNADFYKKAKMAGHLYTTPGNVTDYDFILRDAIDFNNDYILEKMAYDPYNSS